MVKHELLEKFYKSFGECLEEYIEAKKKGQESKARDAILKAITLLAGKKTD